MQPFAKFKKNSEKGVQSHLNFLKISGGSEPPSQTFFKLCKKLHLIMLNNCLKLNIRVFSAGHIVAMVTYCITKIIPTCSSVIGQFFDTMIVALIDKEW